MRNSRKFSRTAAAAMLAGAVLVPAAAHARGGFAHGGHGPIFGFHHTPVVAHRPFRPAGFHRFPGRFVGWWRLNRFANRQNGNWNGVADAGYGAGYYPTGTYDPGDTTGTLAPPAVFAPPAAPSPERVGCVSRGYEVPAERGGAARVTVTRC
jgi:hypothetical protein